MTARQKFQIGDRVSASRKGVEAKALKFNKTGVVTGFIASHPEWVSIKVLYSRHARGSTTYHMDYWDVMPTSEDELPEGFGTDF